MSDKYLENCAIPPPNPDLNLDLPNPECNNCDKIPSKQDVPIIADPRKDKEGIGRQANCDPMQRGHIRSDFTQDESTLHEPWMCSYIPRYSQAKKGCDEAVKNLFEDLIIIDESGTAHQVPIVWATQERAVAAIIQSNVRKDDTTVVDRIRLPMLAIYDSDFTVTQDRYIYHQAVDYVRGLREDGKPGLTTREKYNRDTIFGVTRGLPVDIGYTLFAWTMYKEEMNQIVEQIVLKFSPIAYIRVQGVYWETIVKLESVGNNENVEPGGSNLRVIKWQFNLKAETFIPQPLIRKKAILKTRVQFVDGLDEKEITEIIDRLEDSAKELK